jgi:hypothetical protein
LREAIAGAKEAGVPGEFWQAEAALGRLHLDRAEHEQAEQAFSRAASTIRLLAGNISSDEMRAHFLAAPQVRYILMHAKEE